jgi:DNA-binding CsgD family transcriptional regulator/PAS domain-containing protein
MRTSVDSVARLIGRIYDVAYQREALAPVMVDLARLFSGSRACLLRQGDSLESYQVAASADDFGDFIGLGFDTLRNERLFGAMQMLPVGPIVARDQLVDEPTFRRGEVWERLFRPRDMDFGLACKLRAAGTTNWFVDLHRSAKQGPLSHDELRLFQEILPHFERATRISAEFDDIGALAKGAPHLSGGALLVDGDGHIQRANAEATAFLERADSLLRVTNREIACANPQDTQRLKQLVIDCCRPGAEAMSGAGGSILVGSVGDPQSPALFLSVLPYRGSSPFDLGPVHRAIVLIHEALPSRSEDFERQLRTMFGLTMAETKIAASLSAGLTLQQAAENSAIRINTARWYLEEIYRKTRTNRQGPLIALLARLRMLRPK